MRVVINFREDGGFEVATDEPCEVYTVCDHAPNDRVYRLTETHMVSRAAVDAALREDSVGHSGDSRHAAIKNRILSAEDGTPHLRPVNKISESLGMTKRTEPDFETVVLHMSKREMADLRALARLGYGHEPVNVAWWLVNREIDDLRRCGILKPTEAPSP